MHPAPLALMDYVGPAVGALLFVAAMSVVAEPPRRTLNAIILAGASGVYLSGGFGLWELTYPVIGAAFAFRGLRSYRAIGVGWLMHACWDLAHHLWGNPIWPFMPSSAFGCMIFDSVIALWFLSGAPAVMDAEAPAERSQFDPAVVTGAGGLHDLRKLEFVNPQRLTEEQLIGRARSTSTVPLTGPRWERILDMLRDLHARHRAADGTAEMVYRTEVFLWQRVVTHAKR